MSDFISLPPTVAIFLQLVQISFRDMWHNISFSFTVLYSRLFLLCRSPFFSPALSALFFSPPPNCSSSTRRIEHRLVLGTCANQSRAITEIVPSGEKQAVGGGGDSLHFLGNCSCPGESASETLSRALLRLFFFSSLCRRAVFKTWLDRARSSARRDSPGPPKGHFSSDQNMLVPLHHITSASAASSALTISLIFFHACTNRTDITKPQKETQMQLICTYVRSDTGCCFFTASYWPPNQTALPSN